MNVRLKYQLEFTAGFYFNEQLKMNNYNVELLMTTATTDDKSINIAFERIKFFIGSSLDSGVFINMNNTEQCKLLSNAGVKIITLPDDPVDQLIGIMLYCKLNAICEERMIISDIEITSELGGDMTYLHSDDEPIGPYEQVGWWHNPDLTHYHNTAVKTENILNLNTVVSWRDLDLHWPDDPYTPDTGNTIVFGNFNKDDTK